MKKIVLTLSVAVFLFSCKPDAGSPKGTVTTFIETMKKGDIDGLKKIITKSDVSLMETAESFAKVFSKDESITEKLKKEFVEKSKDVTYSIKDEKVDGDKAEVNVEITDKGKTSTQPFKLVKEDGNWKISLMSTGINMANAEGKLNGEKVNIADSLQMGLEKFKNLNLDSLQGQMKESMEKLKEFTDKNPDAIKKMEEALNKLKENK